MPGATVNDFAASNGIIMPADLLLRVSLRPNNSPLTDSYQSLAISLLRGLAALQVAIAHLRAETFPSLRGMTDPPPAYQALAFATGFAHQGVVVFFLISGWLVGGSLLDKWSQPHALKCYAIDRASRLWTVLIPTFFLMLLAAGYMNRIDMSPSNFDPGNEYSTFVFVGNLLGLQTIAVPNFGRNYALWSLANETWYYILFPLILLVFRSPSAWIRGASALGIAAIASFLPMSIAVYFSLWLLGAGFSRVRIECGPAFRTGLVLICAALSIYYRLTGSNADLVVESYLQDVLCSIPFLVLLATLAQSAPMHVTAMRGIRSAAQALSEFSFTLYVIHVPVIALLRHLARTSFGWERLDPNMAGDYAAYFGAACLLVASAYLVYLAFEANTYRVRRYLKEKLLHRSPRRSGIVPASLK
jgi:peptidoglycan/LPS O-acetylase OafA/YrhL